jgi:hypothetical protein
LPWQPPRIPRHPGDAFPSRTWRRTTVAVQALLPLVAASAFASSSQHPAACLTERAVPNSPIFSVLPSVVTEILRLLTEFEPTDGLLCCRLNIAQESVRRIHHRRNTVEKQAPLACRAVRHGARERRLGDPRNRRPRVLTPGPAVWRWGARREGGGLGALRCQVGHGTGTGGVPLRQFVAERLARPSSVASLTPAKTRCGNSWGARPFSQ